MWVKQPTRLVLAVAVLVFSTTSKSVNPFDPDQRFELAFSNEEPLQRQASIIINSANNEAFKCHFPLDEADTDEGDASVPQDFLEGQTEPHPVQLLSELQDVCLYRLEAYWNYELCIGQHLRQYHEDTYTVGGVKKKKIAEYFLGRGPGSRDKQRPSGSLNIVHSSISGTPKVEKMKVDDEEIPYYSMIYEHGDVCDLTGERRQTEVRFVCAEDGTHAMTAFSEVSTCRYQATVQSYLMCQNKAFAPQEEPLLSIVCTPQYEQRGHAPCMIDMTSPLSSGHTAVKPQALLDIESDAAALAADLKAREAEASKALKEQINLLRTRESTAQPAASPQRQTKTVTPQAAQKHLERPSSRKPVDKHLLRKLLQGTQCFQGGGKNWWKFEVCPFRHVRQFHVHADGRKEFVLLGVWDENVHRQRFREQNQNELKRKSFSHFYEDGDMCAAIDAPRSVEVKYICSTSIPQGQVTLTLEERDTCQYVLTMRSSIICEMLDKLDSERVPVA